MGKLLYYIIYPLFYLVSLLPLKVLYVFSDFLYLILYYIIGYRKKVVRKNLRNSFPDKSAAELLAIEKKFYHWLCDYFHETIKLLSISEKKLLEHIEFRNVEQMEQCFSEGQNCAAILGHYCNWEWLSTTGLAFRQYPDAVMGLIYHRLNNYAFNRLFIDIRSAQGGVCIPKKEILRYLVTCKREKKNYLFGYISDQTPKWKNIHLWLPFLNQDTPVFTGGERIMRKMNDAVFYVEMQRPERGKYICTFKLITKDASSLPEHGVTVQFFKMLEETIKNEPAYYLWTHNRWKRKRENKE